MVKVLAECCPRRMPVEDPLLEADRTALLTPLSMGSLTCHQIPIMVPMKLHWPMIDR